MLRRERKVTDQRSYAEIAAERRRWRGWTGMLFGEEGMVEGGGGGETWCGGRRGVC